MLGLSELGATTMTLRELCAADADAAVVCAAADESACS
jgi:hypothetical protein